MKLKTFLILADLVLAKGIVYQDELAQVCDIVEIFKSQSMLKTGGMIFGYADTTRGYFLKSAK